MMCVPAEQLSQDQPHSLDVSKPSTAMHQAQLPAWTRYTLNFLISSLVELVVASASAGSAGTNGWPWMQWGWGREAGQSSSVLPAAMPPSPRSVMSGRQRLLLSTIG